MFLSQVAHPHSKAFPVGSCMLESREVTQEAFQSALVVWNPSERSWEAFQVDVIEKRRGEKYERQDRRLQRDRSRTIEVFDHVENFAGWS